MLARSELLVSLMSDVPEFMRVTASNLEGPEPGACGSQLEFQCIRPTSRFTTEAFVGEKVHSPFDTVGEST